jgi:NitT/TauT family transport system ATP-binding protein
MAYELGDIHASYEGKKVLDGVSLRLEAESITVILGPSGCGKTTLLNLIAGLKAPDSGQRLGFELSTFSYAFQDPRLLPWQSARENLEFALEGVVDSGQMGKTEARARIDRFLRAAGLSDAASMKPAALSGGMRQRLSLARAFAYPSNILLLDEAFQAVDLRTKLELMDAFLELWKEERRTVVCVTHDVEEAAYLADLAIVLSPSPARVVDSFAVTAPRSERKLGSEATMDAEGRLYRLALGGLKH